MTNADNCDPRQQPDYRERSIGTLTAVIFGRLSSTGALSEPRGEAPTSMVHQQRRSLY
jgi:hypothetical protein